MARHDTLVYFGLRARGEAIRMLYDVSGTKFENVIVAGDSWKEYQPKTPYGQVPTLTTEQGMICHSTVIARHVAKKLGMMGKDLWEETLHDMITESVQGCIDAYSVPNIYTWMVFKMEPEPENKDEIFQKVKDKWIKVFNHAESISKKRGAKYIVGDELGLAEIFMYAAMEFSKLATPDIMTLTPWAKQFAEKVTAEPRMKKHIAERPDALV